MRSMQIYGIRQGGSEQWVDTVTSASAGKAVRERIRREGRYDEIVVRDCLGGLRHHEIIDTTVK